MQLAVRGQVHDDSVETGRDDLSLDSLAHAVGVAQHDRALDAGHSRLIANEEFQGALAANLGVSTEDMTRELIERLDAGDVERGL